MTVLESFWQGLAWYLVLSVIAAIAAPAVVRVFQGFGDGGLFFLRPASLIVFGLPVWWLGLATPVPWVTLSLIISGAIFGTLLWGTATGRAGIVRLIASRWRTLVAVECASLTLFLGYLFLRGFNPDISGTEKPMELAFLNAAIFSDSLPVQDPWFAGEPINYYYFGYAIFAGVAKLTSTDGSVAFNLGLATTFSMATISAAGIARELTSRLLPGRFLAQVVSATLAGFLLVFSSNLYPISRLAREGSQVFRDGWWDGIGWQSSRVASDTGFPGNGERTLITEFPAFSWILGDFHPHLIALPWLILSFALALNLVLVLTSNDRTVSSAALTLSASGIVIGVLYMSNSWDVPIAVSVTVLAILVAWKADGLRDSALSIAIVLAAAAITALPFALSYDSASGAVTAPESAILGFLPAGDWISSQLGYVSWDRSSLRDLTIIHGHFLVLLAVVLFALILTGTTLHRRQLISISVAALFLMIAAIVFSAPALAFIGLPALAIVAIAITYRSSRTLQFALLATVVGLLAVTTVEFFFIRDPFGDRMNTVFKIYFQVWALFSIMFAGLAVFSVARLQERMHRYFSAASKVLLSLVLLSVSLYAPVSAYKWFHGFDSWRGIDGLAWVEVRQPDEYSAIQWINQNAESHWVLLEAPGCSYGMDGWLPHNRFSMATGIPTLIGWDGHQYQWRRLQSDKVTEINQRIQEAREIYERPLDPGSFQRVEQHRITHVIVGHHELVGYSRCEHGPPYAIPPEADWLDAGWTPVFQQGLVTIYGRTSDWNSLGRLN